MRLMLLLVLWMAEVSAGDVYKWVDRTGTVHFGDRPPNTEVERVEIQRGRSAEKPPSGLRPGERRLLDRAAQRTRERLRARQEQLTDQRRTEWESENWKEYCYRRQLDLRQYRGERAQGCSLAECARIDRMIAHTESRIRERCR